MKRLMKDDINGKFCGVCSGIAEYFNIDPTVIRVVWACAFFFWGASLWVYIVLAVALPRKSLVMAQMRSRQEFEQGPGFDTGSAQDVDARPAGDFGPGGPDNGAADARHGEDEAWRESRRGSDGEWK